MRGRSSSRNSVLFTLTLSLGALMVLLAAVPAWAQNPVPPTAREAAALPTFAAKLHPATQPATNRSRAAVDGGRSSPQNMYYENGPVNGTTDAWTINFGYVVSDSFDFPDGNSAGSFDIYVWEFPGDVVSSLQWSITSSPNGGTVYGQGTVNGSNLTDKFISTNQYGYNIDQISATIQGTSVPSGISWLNVFNASVPSGDPVYWDENSGRGCQSQGCPSQAYESAVGTIASEAFDINGGGIPCFVSAANMQIIHDFTGQGDGQNPSGVVADPSGNAYGAMGKMVYQVASKSQGWLFNILYTFTGGSDGSSSSTPIVGPDGALYGAASGGSSNLGLVYSLRPASNPCFTTSCPWKQTVIYQPAGNDDATAPGNLVFDRAGNIYGTSTSGGAYGKGAVFELMPSGAGWTATILYSFTGGSDGAGPGSLAADTDGNLYGTGGGNAYPYGMIFQLVRPPSGGSWAENVIYSFTDGQDGRAPYDLVQGGFDGLFGLSEPSPYQGFVYFLLSPSQGSWEFSVLASFKTDDTGWSNTNLAAYLGDVYFSNGYLVDCDGRDCASPDGVGIGSVTVARPPQGSYTLWDDEEYDYLPSGQLGVDAQGNVYGTTGNCGKYGLGTVWRVTP